jgi:hypothetical protein
VHSMTGLLVVYWGSEPFISGLSFPVDCLVALLIFTFRAKPDV